MQKILKRVCGLTAIMGVFGAFIRWVQGLTAFEEETGLAIPNAPWSYVMFFFMLATAIALIFMVRSFKKYEFPTEFTAAMTYEKRSIDISTYALGAAMALGGLIEAITSFRSEPRSMFGLITGILAMISAICFIVFIRSVRSEKAAPKARSAAVVIVLVLCFWLIATYKVFSSDPVIWHFAPRLLAVSAAIVAFYYIAGYPFNKPRPLLSVFFCQLAAFLLITTLADPFELGEQLIAASTAGFLLLMSYNILNNIGGESGKKPALD